MPGGRPEIYTQELADTVCERVSNGESMRAISRDDSMPCTSTMFKWIREDIEFLQQYEIAKDQGCLAMSEDIISISDDGTNDYMEMLSQNGEDIEGYKQNGEAIQRSRLRVDARKWILSKQMPKKYGDSSTVNLKGNIGLTDLSAAELDRKLEELHEFDESSEDPKD